MTSELAPDALQKLMAWLSPAFPVGTYAYSHGLEWAIAASDVHDAASLTAWIADVVRHGAGRNDAILLAHAWRAAGARALGVLADIAELAAALQPSRERYLESTSQGRAFLLAVGASWPAADLTSLAAALPPALAYPVALGVTAAAHRIPLQPVMVAALGAFVAGLASAGVRAIPIGQTDGQRVTAALASLVREIADEAMALPLDALGGTAVLADLASMRHETQYTRLFRS